MAQPAAGEGALNTAAEQAGHKRHRCRSKPCSRALLRGAADSATNALTEAFESSRATFEEQSQDLLQAIENATSNAEQQLQSIGDEIVGTIDQELNKAMDYITGTVELRIEDLKTYQGMVREEIERYAQELAEDLRRERQASKMPATTARRMTTTFVNPSREHGVSPCVA